MTDPQPMKVRRRSGPKSGAKRGDHGRYVALGSPTPADPVAAMSTDDLVAGDADRSADEHSARARTAQRREPAATTTAKPPSPAQRQSKADYDARPKVIFRGVSQDTYLKLRAMYRRQLGDKDGVLGWSEWGWHILDGVVAQEEQQRGELDTDVDIELPVGRPPTNGL